MSILFYKLLGIFLISASAYTITKSYGGTLTESLSLAKDALSFVRHAKDSIFYKELPVSKIFESYTPKIPIMSEFYRQASTTSPKEILLSSPPKYDKKTLSVMTSFYSELGHSYRDSQLLLCEHTDKLLSDHIKTLEAETSSKNRIFRAVTLFFAASVVLILI